MYTSASSAPLGTMAHKFGMRVVKGYELIVARARVSALSSVDFPALGKPTNPTSATVRSSSVSLTGGSAARPATTSSSSASYSSIASISVDRRTQVNIIAAAASASRAAARRGRPLLRAPRTRSAQLRQSL